MAGDITFLHPTTGDSWQRGSTQLISFTNASDAFTGDLQLKNSSGVFIATVVANFHAVSGSNLYSWRIPDNATLIPDAVNGYKVAITVDPGTSNTFTISGSVQTEFEILAVGDSILKTTIDIARSSAPSAPAGSARLYFDTGDNKLKLAENGGGFVNVTGGSTESEAQQRFTLQAAKKSNAGVYDVTGWATQIAPVAQSWQSVCWSPELGLFAACSSDGTDQFMTSTDGANWTLHPNDLSGNTFDSVCWADTLGKFVAVDIGTAHTVSSTNGVTWTAGTNTGSNTWTSVCWSHELALLVVVAKDAGGGTPITGRIITSTNGTSWTGRTAAELNSWQSVCWSPELTLFCAVSSDGTHQVMTSPDGVTWTARTAAANQTWQCVCWAAELNLFVAVSLDGNAMTSPNGITWTSRGIPGNTWNGICWAAEIGLLAAVAQDGALSTSPNGIAWTTRSVPQANGWTSICWAPELSLFVAVANSGGGFNGLSRVLTSRRYLASTVISNGSFAAQGDAQAVTYVERVITMDGSNTNMFLDGNNYSQSLQLPAHFTTWYFKATIVAQTVPVADSAAFTLEGVIQRTPTANSTVIFPTSPVPKTTVYASAGATGWDVNAFEDPPTDSLVFNVLGAAATTIQWVAKVEIVQTFAAS